MPTYAELRLRIDRSVARGSYRIVATGPAGEALGRFKLPFSDLELENFILKVGSTRRGRRRIDSPEMELAKTFGTKLFGALFEGDVRELYRSSFAETRGAGQGLRVTLSLTGAPELLQVPWEYMYDHPSFLSISTWTPIVRYLDLPKPRRPLQIELPLRILAMVSAPVDFEVIDAAQERTKLETALAPLVGMGAISIDWLEEASLRGLQRQLRKGDYHVFHYIGHGGYDQEADDGVLMFTDEDGRGRRVSGVQLGTILADEVSLRLAVLNSCEGGRSSVQDPFSGVATSLIEREIPAVIGMQFEITDRAAIVFAGEFYSALADGLPVDASVAEARKAIYADQNDIEWGTPVLFMRVADGRLFDVQDHAPLRTVQLDLLADVVVPAASADVVVPAASADVVVPEGSAPAGDPELTDAGQPGGDEADRAELERLQREADQLAEEERAVAAEVARIRQAAEIAERERAATAEAEREAAQAERADRERLERETAEADRAAAAEAERVTAEAARAAAAADAARVAAEASRIETERAEEARIAREAAEHAAAVETSIAAGPSAGPAPANVAGAAGIAVVAAAAPVAAARTPEATWPEKTPVAAAASPTTSWGLARTAGRAAIGSLLGLAMIWLWVFVTEHWRFESNPIEFYFGVFIAELAWTVVTITAVVTLAENLVPTVRVPNGRTYRLVGGNRWTATALQGAVVGATVGIAVTYWYYTSVRGEEHPLDLYEVFLHSIFTAFGFVIAEGLLGRVFSRPLAQAKAGPLRTGTPGDPGGPQSSAARTKGSSRGIEPVPRAAGRSAVGAILTMVLFYALVFIPNGYYHPDAVVPPFIKDTLWIAVVFTAVVSVAEGLWPAVRVPGGRAYLWVGGNRFAAAAIEGAFVGATVGFVVMVLQYSPQTMGEKFGPLVVITSVSFVLAEIFLERATRGRPQQPTSR